MKLSIASTASALVSALLLAAPQQAQASLAKSEGLTTLYEALADITRPPSLKHLPSTDKLIGLSSDPTQPGVQWNVQQTQPTILQDGDINVPNFKLVTQGEKSGE